MAHGVLTEHISKKHNDFIFFLFVTIKKIVLRKVYFYRGIMGKESSEKIQKLLMSFV